MNGRQQGKATQHVRARQRGAAAADLHRLPFPPSADWGRNSPVRHPRHASHPPCWYWLRPVAPPPGTDPLPLKELHSVRIYLLVADLNFPRPWFPPHPATTSYSIPHYLSVPRMHDTPVDSLATRSSLWHVAVNTACSSLSGTLTNCSSLDRLKSPRSLYV